MNEEIRQIQPLDPEIGEEWLRETDVTEIRNVSASSFEWPSGISGWQVAVWAMEFVREDPLEAEMRERVTEALRRVSGVTSADEQDRETWVVIGNPSGRALVEAAAQVVDDLADQLREYMRILDEDLDEDDDLF